MRLHFAQIIASLVIGLAAMTCAMPAAAQTAECDRLAASPLDPMRPANVPGVPFEQVDGPAATKACSDAFAKNPGDARTEFQLARALQRAGASPQRVAELYRDAYNRGSMLAAHNLANAYETGTGVSQDQAEATRLYKKAAEGGVSLSINLLGWRLAQGIGTEKNDAEAVIWFRKSAEAGTPAAMEALAEAYANGGLSLRRDDEEARRWYEKAAAAGSLKSRALLKTLPALALMTSAEIVALQTRLADAQCYKGDLNGKPSMQLQAAVAACPDQRPQLRIETGMHVALIRRTSVDARCTLAATASEDKTVRLWSLPEGKLLRTLRWPIGAGNSGKLYATAVSPDGRYVAAGGLDAGVETTHIVSVTIFDAASGAIVARAWPFENAILHLTFSRDGRWLVATLGGGAVRMIDTSTWRREAADKAYGESSYGAAFGQDGRLYTVADDGKIRRYGPGPVFKKEAEVTAHGGRNPYSITIDPSGTLLAVGFDDTTVVDLYDAATLRFLKPANTKFINNGNLFATAWRNDGQVLFAGGRYHDANGKDPILAFSRDGQRLGAPIPLADDTILNIQPCGTGFAVAAGDPAFGLIDGEGRKLFWRGGVAADMRGKRGDGAFTISSDARSVRFGLKEYDAQPVSFDLRLATLIESPHVTSGFISPKVDNLPITNWINTKQPLFAGRQIALNRNEISRSLAVRDDKTGFVLGADFSLHAFNAQGEQRWEQAVPGTVWGVNLSADGKIIVAAYGDGTIRWHRWSDGQELLALFVNKETKAWVAWTPSGYYMASPGGEDMIGWHVNRGWDQAADFFPASKFRDQFSRPDIVEKVLDTLDEAEAVKEANAARPGKVVTTPITEHLPPVLSILAPLDGSSAGEEAHIDYLVRSPSGLPVDAIEAQINGRPISTGRGLGRVASDDTFSKCLAETHGLGRVDGALQGCRGSLSLSLPPGTSEVGLIARSGDITSVIASIRLTRTTAATGDELLKPKLYALIVGISAYQNPDYRLAFAAKDAHDFAEALENQKGGLYADVTIKLLTDEQATTVAIRDALDLLKRQVTSRDVGVVYLAGHGMLDERDRFYFLAADSNATRLLATAVPRDDIADTLDAISGKALLFLDACHSGAIVSASARRAIDINSVINDFTRGEHGVIAFTASTGKQASQENAAWNNGAFTKAVVEALGLPGQKGKADLRGDGKITTSELDAYVTERVKTLTGGTQSPIMIRPPTVPDFPIAVAR